MATAPLAAVTGSALAAPSDSDSDYDTSSGHDEDYSLNAEPDSYDSDDASSDDEDSSEPYKYSFRHDTPDPESYQPVHTASYQKKQPSSRSSASNTKWDKLAKCESTQNWDADTGNGYKGGLQFTDSTWRSYGGKKYAPSADQANRDEQIAVAKKVQQEQGWNAWPSCSKKLGYS
ncbi:MAG TPA: transglycosylase family protein [Pseudonocardia sp.]